ncbi:MAG: hypothetical protein AAB532_01580 [Patescibacteria group bacterium]
MHERNPHSPAQPGSHREGLGFGVGQRDVRTPTVKDPQGALVDRRRLRAKKLEPLKKVIDHIHDQGSEVYGYWAAHKGFVLSVVSAAAFSAGVVGVGARIRRRGERRR